jgi:FtsP/CotA-like multicopper oxidase with cupredoxin domain
VSPRLLPALAFLALIVGAASGGLGAPPAAGVLHSYTWDVTAIACATDPEGICLAYDGQIPGPTLDVRLGDLVEITLNNRIRETLAALGDPTTLPPAPDVSFHVHGTSIPATMDGVAAHAGTDLASSVAAADASFTYRFRAGFVGTWHYHDHVLGPDGAQGTLRGLYGSLVVRNGAEARPTSILDLHLHDNGANGGRGLDANAAAGSAFDIVHVGLGNRLWEVAWTAPNGETLAGGTFSLGPGMSERVSVPVAMPGVYSWMATNELRESVSGEVVVA